MTNWKSTIAILGLVTVLISCANKPEPEPQPNILWINLDDLGLELGCYGNPDVQTPNIDALAENGVLYTRAYVTAPICSPSRSSMITGMHPASVNSIEHRPLTKTPLPEGILPVTEYFRQAGYFCTNGHGRDMDRPGKSDFNFKYDNVFNGTDWKQRKPGQPFFAQVQIFEPHRPFLSDAQNPIDPSTVQLPKIYPDEPLIRADWTKYLETIQIGDSIVGTILTRLEQEGLMDNTIIFLFGDNGRPHLRDKQFLYEGSLRVPLIIKSPFNTVAAGTKNDRLLSMIDVTASSLQLAGIEVPKHMHGKDFLGESAPERNYIFAARQRSGDAVEHIRCVSNGDYKLIWNRLPETPWMQMSGYKWSEYPAYTLYHHLHKTGKLEAPHNLFMADQKPEWELYDLKSDPSELNNLADEESHQSIKMELSTILKDSLAVFETNRIPESPEVMAKSIKASKDYFKRAMKRINMSEDATEEEMIEYWESELLNQ